MDARILEQVEKVKTLLENSVDSEEWADVNSALEIIEELYFELDRGGDTFDYDYD